jgi:hypothetical protein
VNHVLRDDACVRPAGATSGISETTDLPQVKTEGPRGLGIVLGWSCSRQSLCRSEAGP